jgi:dihydrofolate reductase
MITAILAMDDRCGIGKYGMLPWQNKADMKFFKETTRGAGNNTIVMGRKTKESLLNWFPLPDRNNLVMTRTPMEEYHITSFGEAIERSSLDGDIFVIGGREIYIKAFKEGFVDEVLVSRIKGDYCCDTFLEHEELHKYFRLYSTHKQAQGLMVEIWKKKD